MNLDKTLYHELHYVVLKDDTHHLYWPYSRVTLCRKDKQNALSVTYIENPVCADCAKALVELSVGAKMAERIA